MGKAPEYDLHVLADGVLPEERYTYDDPAKAVIAFNRLACERRRRAVLSKTGHLPGLEAEIVASYVPEDDAPPVTPIRRDDPFVVEADGGVRFTENMLSSIANAARWYAYGIIDGLGALSPFRREEDAQEFSAYHRGKAERGKTDSVMESWAEWSAVVRQERGL